MLGVRSQLTLLLHSESFWKTGHTSNNTCLNYPWHGLVASTGEDPFLLVSLGVPLPLWRAEEANGAALSSSTAVGLQVKKQVYVALFLVSTLSSSEIMKIERHLQRAIFPCS